MKIKVAIFFSLIFFVLGFATLTHYGINWDTINHLPRGQIYLHYFLTGKKDFSDFPLYVKYWQKPEELMPDISVREQKGVLRSYYQSDAADFDSFMGADGAGHPPLSDILSSVFNRVLFGYLKIVNDIDSYRVYGVFLAASLVGLIFFWVSKIYGGFAGLISALCLATYPLFWAESHFNTEKDVPETVFWSFFLFCIWNGVIKKSWKWILASGVFFGLALGTKFNILFSVLVFLPWIFIYLKKKIFKKEYLKLSLFGILAFIIGITIFYASWPYLWPDVIAGIQKVFGFYKAVGTSFSIDQRFIGPFGFNTYAISWIVFTTPIPVLILSLLGFLGILFSFKKDKYKTGMFFLLWFLTPIFRISFPGSNIYGGIRQIMEYIPGMAAVAGIGATFIIRKLRVKKLYAFLFIVLASSFLIFNLYRIHPNENAYFNSLIGGLAGAKAKNLPSWGNTFGGAYRQGVEWINRNAEPNSSLVFAHELMPNIPRIWVRPDISFSNSYMSGFLKKGEYAISLTYQGMAESTYYHSYLDKLAIPVYESVVDGVATVKVWKNDSNYLKPEYRTQYLLNNVDWEKKGNNLIIDLGRDYVLSHLMINYGENHCGSLKTGVVYLSEDKVSWKELRDKLPMNEIPPLGEQPSKGVFFYPFTADKAGYIRIDITPEDSCLINRIISLEVYGLDY